MGIKIPQGNQTNQEKAQKRGKNKVKNKAEFDSLTQKQQIDALRDALLELTQAVQGGANES